MNDLTPGQFGSEADLLIEQVAGSWRPRDRDGRIEGHPAWYDLSEADRALAFDTSVTQRRLESALDPQGLSSTAHAVLRLL